MKLTNKKITCGNIVLATTTLCPESFLDKLIGLRGKQIFRCTGMIFENINPIIECFDTFFCESIGYLALDKEMKVISCGIMKPNRIKFIRCKHWIELHPDMIHGISKHMTITISTN